VSGIELPEIKLSLNQMGFAAPKVPQIPSFDSASRKITLNFYSSIRAYPVQWLHIQKDHASHRKDLRQKTQRMNTQHLYLSQIRTVLPKEDFEFIEQTEGQFHDVIIINREWIFRFPRSRQGVERISAEVLLLEALRGRLPLRIPDPVHQRFDPPVPGLAFMGYRRLEGEPFERDSLESVPGEWARDDLASQLSHFLRALHAIPAVEVVQTPPRRSDGSPQLRSEDGREVWEAMYTEVREKLYPAMRPDARQQVTQHFEVYLDDPRLQTFEPRLRHGDFGGSNILWDAVRNKITAVIDFSFCAMGDPAADLASISTLGEDFLARIAARYEQDDARRAELLARARFYRGTFALSEALDGLRDGDKQAYHRGIENYV
jgi:aminoglycoside 2''-phosphotransferase